MFLPLHKYIGITLEDYSVGIHLCLYDIDRLIKVVGHLTFSEDIDTF